MAARVLVVDDDATVSGVVCAYLTRDGYGCRVVADGSHDELLETSELYGEIVRSGLPDQVFLNRKTPEVAGL